MGARQAVELVERRAIAGGADPQSLADGYAAAHLPVAVSAAAGFVDEVIEPAATRDRIIHELEVRGWR
jgi:acetyl-CoA carboxylase carboxyltransferase component